MKEFLFQAMVVIETEKHFLTYHSNGCQEGNWFIKTEIL